MKLFYMGLEKYKSRYTLQLQDWNERVFKKRTIEYVIVPGDTLTSDQAIVTGQVLDAHGRSYFSMSQMMNLIRMMKNGQVNSDDVIYFEDMFSPGMESLPYILDQVDPAFRPRVYVRCLAQSIDPDDFVHVCNMQKWMGHFEKMVDSFVTGVLATNEEMVAHMKIAGWTAPVYNISGLAFGKEEVQSRVKEIIPFDERLPRVVFAARTDREKQPHFFMDLIDAWYKELPNSGVVFSVLSGGPLRGNDPSAIERMKKMQAAGTLTIHENLEKNEYYSLLNNSRVLINTALQDWVSNTVSEADALGCNVLYPAYRSFPETFANDHERLYVPWSITDAMHKLYALLSAPHENTGKISNWNDGTIDRICDIITGNGEEWNRTNNDYRKYTTSTKYI